MNVKLMWHTPGISEWCSAGDFEDMTIDEILARVKRSLEQRGITELRIIKGE